MRTETKLSIFRSLFSTKTYGCSGECHCGIFHYDIANDWDDDYHQNTLPAVQERAKDSPEGYQFHDAAIERLEFDGYLYVIGCRCGMDDFIFRFFNESKSQILNYFVKTKDEVSVDDAL